MTADFLRHTFEDRIGDAHFVHEDVATNTTVPSGAKALSFLGLCVARLNVVPFPVLALFEFFSQPVNFLALPDTLCSGPQVSAQKTGANLGHRFSYGLQFIRVQQILGS
jgi:hypothetical protein